MDVEEALSVVGTCIERLKGPCDVTRIGAAAQRATRHSAGIRRGERARERRDPAALRKRASEAICLAPPARRSFTVDTRPFWHATKSGV